MTEPLTRKQLIDKALVRAGLRAPNQRQFTLNSAEAFELFRVNPPSMLTMIPLVRHNPVIWELGNATKSA